MTTDIMDIEMEHTYSNYASLGRRFVALLLDGLILLIPCAIGGNLIPVLGGIIVWFFYAPVLEASALRATIGKHLMGVQVVDSMGRRISLKAAVIRNALKFVSTAMLFAGFIMALFTRKKQGLHDLLAETYVVYGRNEMPIGEAWVNSAREVFNFPPLQSEESHPSAASDAISQLERLQALREKGAITEEEFQEQKRRILGV